MAPPSPRRRCTATTRAGTPCRAWAAAGSEPPRCASHGGAAAPPGPPDSAHGGAHGVDARPALDDALADLERRIRGLSAELDRIDPQAERETYARWLHLYGQLCSRLGRLLRDRQALAGDGGDELQAAINEALDIAAQTLGVEL